MGRISAYKKQVPNIVLTNIPNLEGETITCTQRVSLGFIRWMSQTLPNAVDEEGERLNLSFEDFTTLLEGFCREVIVDWSFTDDDDRLLPITADNLNILDPADIVGIIGLYLGTVMSPLVGGQGSGEPLTE